MNTMAWLTKMICFVTQRNEPAYLFWFSTELQGVNEKVWLPSEEDHVRSYFCDSYCRARRGDGRFANREGERWISRFPQPYCKGHQILPTRANIYKPRALISRHLDFLNLRTAQTIEPTSAKTAVSSLSASTRYLFLHLSGVGRALSANSGEGSAQWAFPANSAT